VMPEMDGYTLCSKVKSSKNAQRAPISSTMTRKPPAFSNKSVARNARSRDAHTCLSDFSVRPARAQSRRPRLIPIAAAESGSNASATSTYAHAAAYRVAPARMERHERASAGTPRARDFREAANGQTSLQQCVDLGYAGRYQLRGMLKADGKRCGNTGCQ
jgi:CheY-like chemotaxis protein